MLIKILKALEQEIKRLREAIRFIKTTESRFFRLIEIASPGLRPDPRVGF
jgi:hypothetical protein